MKKKKPATVGRGLSLLSYFKTGYLFWCWQFNFPSETEYTQDPNKVPSEIYLPPVQTVSGGLKSPVVVVVPSLTKTNYPKQGIVPTEVCRLKWTFSPKMADGVDAPCGVMN